MKVNIYETVEVDDDQRKKIASLADGSEANGKRIATREELKDYIWGHGRDWAIDLSDAEVTVAEAPDDDLI